MKPLFVQSYEQNLVDKPIFTVYMSKNGYKEDVPGGQITFGGLDTDNCNCVIDYVPLTTAAYWQFHVSSLSVNGGSALNDGWEVISDTGYLK
jgi:cathepsin D